MCKEMIFHTLLQCLALGIFVKGPNIKPYEIYWTLYLDQRRSQAGHIKPQNPLSIAA